MNELNSRIKKSSSADVALVAIRTWEDVVSNVQGMMDGLKHKQESSRFRRATGHLRAFCNTIKAHSETLKILPTNNNYITVFYGALSMVLQVSRVGHKLFELAIVF